MSNEIIKPSDLYLTVNKILDEFGQAGRVAVIQSVEKVAKQAEEKLHSAGDFGGTKYKKSWTSQVSRGRTEVEATVYNAKHYQLTHLLEFGHAKQNGGRTREFPHIAPINDWAQEEVEKEIERCLL